MSLAEQVRERLGGELEVLPGGHSGLTYTVGGKYVVNAVPPGQKPVGRNDVCGRHGSCVPSKVRRFPCRG